MNGLEAAIKVLRGHGSTYDSFRRWHREVGIWAKMDHPNVLLFLGVGGPSLFPGKLSLISPWMEHGNLSKFLQNRPDANRRALVAGIGEGLSYLHENGVVHGDLKGSNVLVGSDLQPRLADFGLSILLDREEQRMSTSTALTGTSRWKAPEQFVPERFGLTPHTCRTKASDIYALGMTIFEIMSGNIPFHETQDRHGFIIYQLVVDQGRRPRHPGPIAIQRGLDSGVWLFVLQTWRSDAGSRPPLSDLRVTLSAEASETPDLAAIEAPFARYWEPLPLSEDPPTLADQLQLLAD